MGVRKKMTKKSEAAVVRAASPTIIEAKKLAIDLHAASDELSKLLRDAEHALVESGLGVAAQVALDDSGNWLCFDKRGGKWGLRVSSMTLGVPETDLLNASRRVRVLAAYQLPALLDALLGNLARDREQVRQANEDARLFLTKLAAATKEGP